MSEFTKGPWVYENSGGDGIERHEISAPSRSVWIAHASPYLAETPANARLIAAAPELLEALKNLVSLAKDYVADAEDWHEYQRAVVAIGKAEGS